MKKITSLLLAMVSVHLVNPENGNAMEDRSFKEDAHSRSEHSFDHKAHPLLSLQHHSDPYEYSLPNDSASRFSKLTANLNSSQPPEERISLLQESLSDQVVLSTWRDNAKDLRGQDLLKAINTSRNILGYYTEEVNYHGRSWLKGATTPELQKVADQFLFQVFQYHLGSIQSTLYKDKYQSTLNGCVFKAIEVESSLFKVHGQRRHNDFKAYAGFIFDSFKIIPVEMIHDVMCHFLSTIHETTKNLHQAHKRTKFIFKKLTEKNIESSCSHSRSALKKHHMYYWEKMLSIFMKFEDLSVSERIQGAERFLNKTNRFSNGKSIEFLVKSISLNK